MQRWNSCTYRSGASTVLNARRAGRTSPRQEAQTTPLFFPSTASFHTHPHTARSSPRPSLRITDYLLASLDHLYHRYNVVDNHRIRLHRKRINLIANSHGVPRSSTNPLVGERYRAFELDNGFALHREYHQPHRSRAFKHDNGFALYREDHQPHRSRTYCVLPITIWWLGLALPFLPCMEYRLALLRSQTFDPLDAPVVSSARPLFLCD